MPRKPIPDCPPELQEQLDVINMAPKTSAEWDELTALLKQILTELTNARDPIYLDEDDDNSTLENYRRAVLESVPTKFHAFALSLEDQAESDIDYFHLPGRKELTGALLRIRLARQSLHSIVRDAIADNGSGWLTTNTQRNFVLENWFLTEAYPSDPLSVILSNNIPIDRLNICSICDKVYWQKYRGKVRVSETCGDYECGYKLANLKRKAPPEKRFRMAWKEEKSDGSI